jgi:hypothetical protein
MSDETIRSGPYFTNAGRFAERYQGNPGAIGVTAEAGSAMPIGMAFCIGRDDHGAAVWRLVIGKVDVPGRWVVQGGRFVPSAE